MISEILWSPIPWVLAALFYSMLSWNRIRDNFWVKWPRRIIGVTAITILVGGFIIGSFATMAKAKRHQREMQAIEEKGNAANQAAQATARKLADPDR